MKLPSINSAMDASASHKSRRLCGSQWNVTHRLLARPCLSFWRQIVGRARKPAELPILSEHVVSLLNFSRFLCLMKERTYESSRAYSGDRKSIRLNSSHVSESRI